MYCGYSPGLTSCHENAAHNQELLVVSSEHTQQDQHNTSTSQDTESNRKTANTDINGVMTVNIERLSRPEHEHREEVGSGDESDDQSQTQGSRLLLQACGEDGVFSAVYLPETKGSEQEEAKDQRGKDVSGAPGVLWRSKRAALEQPDEAA